MQDRKSLSATRIIERLSAGGSITVRALDKLKRLASKEGQHKLITNTDLFSAYTSMVELGEIPKNNQIESVLTVKRMRSESGVSIITVLTMPFPCPGTCVYCPDEERMPKSYIASEPAAARALALKFDPYTQVRRRIEMLEGNGHPTDKIELIIKGGTWSSYPTDYQEWFVHQCIQAMNETGVIKRELEPPDPSYQYTRFHGETKKQWNVGNLLGEQTKNETALHRCIGLTIETRPDCISMQEIKRLRVLGCTRVELGVQTTDDAVLALIQRGHTTDHVRHATKLLKDAGFKVDYHMMPGLPGSTPEKDLGSLNDLFTDEGYQPDMLKIYPTVVTPHTELENMWKRGDYTPYSQSQLISLLAAMKTAVPPHVRISRVIRDIPSYETVAGNTKTNLRETVQDHMQKLGMKCRCLRCREVAHRKTDSRFTIQDSSIQLVERAYMASGGRECFLSFEDVSTDTIFAFLRMRFPSRENATHTQHLPEIKDCVLIRELHTYGQLVPIDASNDLASQHKGYGKMLLSRAEDIAREAGYQKIAVISGIGVREYYRKRGYSLVGTYMIKLLEAPS